MACGTTYVEELDAHGFERLIPVNSVTLRQQGLRLTEPAGPSGIYSRDKGKAVEREETPTVSSTAVGVMFLRN